MTCHCQSLSDSNSNRSIFVVFKVPDVIIAQLYSPFDLQNKDVFSKHLPINFHTSFKQLSIIPEASFLHLLIIFLLLAISKFTNNTTGSIYPCGIM